MPGAIQVRPDSEYQWDKSLDICRKSQKGDTSNCCFELVSAVSDYRTKFEQIMDRIYEANSIDQKIYSSPYKKFSELVDILENGIYRAKQFADDGVKPADFTRLFSYVESEAQSLVEKTERELSLLNGIRKKFERNQLNKLCNLYDRYKVNARMHPTAYWNLTHIADNLQKEISKKLNENDGNITPSNLKSLHLDARTQADNLLLRTENAIIDDLI